jgi:hypothetical protein
MRYSFAAIAVFLVAIVFLYGVFGTYMLCDGSYTLAIAVSSTDPIPIKWATCQAFRRDKDADEYLGNLVPFKSSIWSDLADPFDGREMRVDIPYSFKESCGFIWDDSQPRILVVLVAYTDGRCIGKKTEIPHRSVAKDLSVQFP